MIYLNIGSNLPLEDGGRENNILKAINHLKKLNLNLIKISSFYETPSYPNNSDPKFINLCVKFESKLKAIELLNEIKKIEKKLGRTRIKKNDPRTCDIDIIDFNGKIIKNDELETPHPRLHLRNFVIYPLKEIEPNWFHPIYNKNIDSFFKELDKNSHNEITRLIKSDILN
jgi:2-amino-4-hydroxy-6-hydroxymethyldihydropteridine diphosphokinase